MAISRPTGSLIAASITAGGANVNSGWIDVATLESGSTPVDLVSLSLRITNGATGPTSAGQFIIETSPDNGTTIFALGGAITGGLANSGVYGWGEIPLPKTTKYFRVTAGTGTNIGQTVTYQANYTSYLKT